MRRTVKQLSIPLVAVLALSLVIVAVITTAQLPVPVQAAAAEVQVAQEPDNSKCLSCHGQSGNVHTFPNGDTVSIFVDEQVFSESVHANLACQVCHTGIVDFPHPEMTAQTPHEYTQQFKDSCNQCHPSQVAKVEDGAHAKLAEQGNPNTPVCADCHNPHIQAKIEKDTNGDPAASENQKIAETCAVCHATIVEDYKNSVHGEAVFADNNPDVPACHDCHGIHNMATARSVEFRLNSPNLCADCHTRSDIMSKYGISTDVMDTYVADFHGTTVTLFERTSPDMPTNKAVCYDCHGVHNIMRTDDPQKGLQVRENMLTTCQKCHPDANENFPTSWMSHYIATQENYPLVFYVQWFYKLFIPGVLGGMGIFVLTDILRKVGITRRNNSDSPSTKE